MLQSSLHSEHCMSWKCHSLGLIIVFATIHSQKIQYTCIEKAGGDYRMLTLVLLQRIYAFCMLVVAVRLNFGCL